MTNEEKKELQSAYDDYIEASNHCGGDDWGYGGNPHRMMEYESERDAWNKFVNLCTKYGVDPNNFRG